MNKKELIQFIAKHAEISEEKARLFLEYFVAIISQELEKGNEVSLRNLGVFLVQNRPARTIKAIGTGRPMKVASRKVAKFRPSKQLHPGTVDPGPRNK
jgi:DNA-binding protein HU-beta